MGYTDRIALAAVLVLKAGMKEFTAIIVARNEAPFLLEWLAHHLALGFTKFVLCTYDCADGTVRMARRLERMGYVHRHNLHVENSDPITSALSQVAEFKEVSEAEWLFVSTPDCFLNIEQGRGYIESLVEGRGDSIALKTRRFGADQIDTFLDQPVTRQFIRRQSDREHEPVMLARSIEGLNTEADLIEPEVAVIHKYMTSKESLAIRQRFGRCVDTHLDTLAQVFQEVEAGRVLDATINQYNRWHDRYAGYLLGDTRLRKIHQSAVEWHQKRAAMLREDPEMEEFWNSPEGDGN